MPWCSPVGVILNIRETARASELRKGRVPIVSLLSSVARRCGLPPRRLLGRVAVTALAVLAAICSLFVSKAVFPYPSANLDEAVYLLQADTLRQGQLFPPAPPRHPEAFQPFFTRQRGEAFVPKYSPVHPGILALGRIVFGTYRAGPALVAGALVVSTYLLAVEVLHRRGEALLAAGFLAASPLVVVQSATYLSYLSALLMLELFAVALLRGSRLNSTGWHVVAGFLLGVAFFARSYDALLFGLPFAVLFVTVHRRSTRTMIKRSSALIIGVAPVLVAYAAFNVAATGHPLHPPFAIDPTDTIGFGSHRLVPGDPYFEYTPRQGLIALSRYLTTTSFWILGGIPLVGCAIAALACRRGGASGRALAGVILAVPIGYFFFWGMSVSSVLSAGVLYLGPWYYTALFGPLVILGAGGFSLLWRRGRVMAGLALVAMVALSSFVTVRALAANSQRATDERRLNQALETVPTRSLIFLPADVLLTPFSTARNPTLDGPVLYALDRGPSANIAVAGAYPGRRPYLLQFPPARGGPQPASQLRPLQVVSGANVTIPIDVGRPLPEAVLTAEWRGARVDCKFAPDATAWLLRVAPTGVTCTSPTRTKVGLTDLPPEFLFVTIIRVGDGQTLYRWAARTDAEARQVFLTPPLAAEVNDLPGGRGVNHPAASP